MPLVILHCAANPENEKALLSALSDAVVKHTGKPKNYVMAMLNRSSVFMGGMEEPAAFVDIRSIGGIEPESNKALSKDVCTIIQRHLNIDPALVYINFTDIERSNWGWKGLTFG